MGNYRSIRGNYFPLGIGMMRRSVTTGYWYGFNGMEKERDTFEGAYDFGARILDARLGRWLSVGPLGANYPNIGNYTFCADNPIILIDPYGKKIIPAGDQRVNASPEQTAKALESYFYLVFGFEMADVLMMALNSDSNFGSFSKKDKISRNQFAREFKQALKQIEDENVRVLAIGVYEAIMSSQSNIVIVYLDNDGMGNQTRWWKLKIDNSKFYS